MFDPILKENGTSRLTYATPLSFRVVCAAVAIIIFLSVALVPGGTLLSRLGVVPLVLICLCAFGALYLDRWTFDKAANVFQQDVGILLLHARRRRPLDSLRKVVLFQRGSGAGEHPSVLGPRARGTVVLSVVDRDGRVFKLNLSRGGGTRALRVYAERLAAFCSVPLEQQGSFGQPGSPGRPPSS